MALISTVPESGNYAHGGTHLILENSVFDTLKNPHYGDNGSLVAMGNIYHNTSGRREAYGTPFFDPANYYNYQLDSADEVVEIVSRCAGPRAELNHQSAQDPTPVPTPGGGCNMSPASISQ